LQSAGILDRFEVRNTGIFVAEHRHLNDNLIEMQQQIGEIIIRHLVPSENFIYGFADLTGLLHKKFSGFNYGISIGRKLDYSIVGRITGGPTLEILQSLEMQESVCRIRQKQAINECQGLRYVCCSMPHRLYCTNRDLFIAQL
jgi:hypothetical protein